MAITSYSELQTAVQGWLAREDLVARIPDFIALAEAKFNRGLRYHAMEKRSSISVDMSSSEPQFISLPTDFQTAVRVYLPEETGKPHLEYVEQGRAAEYATLYTTAARPIFYSIFGDEMELVPTPNDAYRVEMVYRALIPALSDNNTSNWLLAIAPDAYLYGALLEAAPYMKEDERIEVWGLGLKTALEGLNNLGGGLAQ